MRILKKTYWCFHGLYSTFTSGNYLTFTSKLLVLFKIFLSLSSLFVGLPVVGTFVSSFLFLFLFFLIVIGVVSSLWIWCLALFPLMDILPLFPLQHTQLLTGWQIWIWYLFRLPTWTDSWFLKWFNVCNFLHFHRILSKQNCASQCLHFNHLNRKFKSTRHPQIPYGLAICHCYWLICSNVHYNLEISSEWQYNQIT